MSFPLEALEPVADEYGLLRLLVAGLDRSDVERMLRLSPVEGLPQGRLSADVLECLFASDAPRFPSRTDPKQWADLLEALTIYGLSARDDTSCERERHLSALANALLLHMVRSRGLHGYELEMFVRSVARLGAAAAFLGCRFVVWHLLDEKYRRFPGDHLLAAGLLIGVALREMTQGGMEAVTSGGRLGLRYMDPGGFARVWKGVFGSQGGLIDLLWNVGEILPPDSEGA